MSWINIFIMKLKKPKFWDNPLPNFYAYMLLPFSFLIRVINYFKSNKPKKNSNINIKTICVGNIYLGGTGKTSLAIKINQIFKDRKLKSCFVKKFYESQKDEQNILKKNGKLFVHKKRENALKDAAKENFEIAIFDDGLQDNTIYYDKKIVCFNNINWIGNGMTIPSGPLRESINSLTKYENIFLNGNLENLEHLKEQIFKINSKANIHIGIYEPTNLKEFDLNDNYFAFSGIGNHNTFISMIRKFNLKIQKDLEFPDHYQYSKEEINKIIKEASSKNYKIITTEKDYERIKNENYKEIKFIKTELKILDEEKFIQSII